MLAGDINSLVMPQNNSQIGGNVLGQLSGYEGLRRYNMGQDPRLWMGTQHAVRGK